jgi:alcohol dehydrogenase (cytochrome c)
MRAIALILAAAAALTAQVRYEDIVKGPGANWLTYMGDYGGQRHSPLTQITPANAANLAAKWTYHVPGANHLEATPLVYDGVMYMTDANQIHAIDARSGRRIWMYRDGAVKRQSANRGAALLGNKVFFLTSDCHLVALDRRTGALLWSKEYASLEKDGHFATMAPLALKDRVIVGVGGGDGGIRGVVIALSAETGDELWRFWTVPAKGEPGSETWSEFPLEYGGGATWMNGTYDAQTNTVYWAAGNPWPDQFGKPRRGDNLYTCSMLALDGATGKLKWYFQFTPHDTHDWDAQSIPVLVDLPWKGATRKVLLHANRNGFFYVLDRVTGEFLSGTPFIDKLNWATGIDAKGRPIELPNIEPTPAGRYICPSLRGASNWMSPAFNPQTGLLYVPTLEQCDVYTVSETVPEPKKEIMGGGSEPHNGLPGKFYLRAIDPLTGKRKWEYPMTGGAESWAGAVSTAGGVIFFGDDDGQMVAVDAKTGHHLWHYTMGQNITASPIVFSVDGKQYVSIAATADVYTFGLFEPAKPTPLVPTRTGN